jgi:hypothetical protein
VVPDTRDGDALSAARLAREVLARSGRDASALAGTGLLDPSLPTPVRVEVLRECGRAGCAFGLSLALAADAVGRAAVLCGAAEALAETGMAYARERVVFGKPLATMPVQRLAFASVCAGVEAAVALVRRVACGAGSSWDADAVLPFALDAAWAAAEAALQVHGGYGYSDEYPVSRMWHEVAAARASLAGSV